MTWAWLSVIGKFIKSVPWPFWLFVAVCAAAWYYGEVRADAREAKVNAQWEAAQAEADAKAKAAEVKRDAGIDVITDWTATEGHKATTDTRTTTAAAVEKVRYVTRTIVVPAGCPTGDPRVSREGREAVARARAAAGQVRASPDAGRP